MDIPCVGAVIRDAEGRLLVVRRGNPPSAGKWSIPGGRVEPGETLRDAVRREVREETGLDVDVDGCAGRVVLPAVSSQDRYLVTDFHARVRPGASSHPVAADDAVEASWVTHAELQALDTTTGLDDTLGSWGIWAASGSAPAL